MRNFKILKKLTVIMLVCFLVAVSLCVAGCNEQSTNYGNVKVTFELEGGTYKNSMLPVLHYYEVQEGDTTVIANPIDYSVDGITRAGYEFIGWYKNKSESNGEVTYSDEWNFESDRVSADGITLYAGWRKQTNFTYKVAYYNEQGELTVINSYKVQAGDKFNDYSNYANKRIGYTAIPATVKENGDIWVYKTVDGNVWDANFTHPGDEANPDVYVVVDYVKGLYQIVTTAKQLKTYKNSNIYLACDIDMQGESLNFGNYNKSFLGNGHTVSNFTVQYDNTKNGLVSDYENPSENSMYISLFGNAEGATVKDVNFVNASVVVDVGFGGTSKIYVSPVFSTMKGCTVQNVTYTGTFSYVTLPSSEFIQEERLVFVTDKAYYKLLDESSTVELVTVTVTVNQ